ncbi:MAG: aldehyde dehydrogenase family protein [Ureaplasma sp.]|nr:aldehyde dehydrogenase family protein [Ureaplasma sp.]
MNYSVLQKGILNNNFSNPIEIYSPINNQIIGYLPRINDIEIDEIIKDTKRAFYDWKDTPYFVRKELILNFRNRLKMNSEFIANLMLKEIAKNYKECLDEINRSIEYIDLTINEYEKFLDNPLIYTEKEHHIKNKIGKFIYQPIGLVLAIGPFNYPLNLLITKIIPALITGNSVIYKPATQGSLTGAYMSQLFYEAGFINGEIACIVGDGNLLGTKLIESNEIQMINFTGSTKVGKLIQKSSSNKRIVLEMGGKDPAIVLQDADLELTANEIIKGAFSYNGQRCTAIKRVLANEEIYEPLIKLLNKKVKTLKVGSALSADNNNITELISQKSLDYNLSLINDALEHHAKTDQKIQHNNKILYPVILYNLDIDSKINWEESFGPVLPIIKVKNVDEAIKLSNMSNYGLQASIFTQNQVLAEKIALELECGTVNINKAPSRGPDIFPFLGIKDSGIGIQGVKEALISNLQIKGIITNE